MRAAYRIQAAQPAPPNRAPGTPRLSSARVLPPPGATTHAGGAPVGHPRASHRSAHPPPANPMASHTSRRDARLSLDALMQRRHDAFAGGTSRDTDHADRRASQGLNDAVEMIDGMGHRVFTPRDEVEVVEIDPAIAAAAELRRQEKLAAYKLRFPSPQI